MSWEAQGQKDSRVERTMSNSTLEYKVTGLTSLTTYTLEVAAINGAGTGTLSSSTISSGVPPGETLSTQKPPTAPLVSAPIMFRVLRDHLHTLAILDVAITRTCLKTGCFCVNIYLPNYVSLHETIASNQSHLVAFLPIIQQRALDIKSLTP